MQRIAIKTMERFNAISLHGQKSRVDGTTRKTIAPSSQREHGTNCGIAEKKFRNRIRLVGIAGIVIALCGCHVTGTIGGTSNLDSDHKVDVSITFAERG